MLEAGIMKSLRVLKDVFSQGGGPEATSEREHAA
jgi:hypothetical protein